jgi:hypothetical protein
MKDILVYMADLYTVVQYLALNGFDTNPGLDSIRQSKYSFVVETLKWLYLGSIFMSLILLLFESLKARRITKSGYISNAYTNTISYRHYAIASFSYFSFFERIEMYKKPIDRVAFFVFFALKGRFLLSCLHLRDAE